VHAGVRGGGRAVRRPGRSIPCHLVSAGPDVPKTVIGPPRLAGRRFESLQRRKLTTVRRGPPRSGFVPRSIGHTACSGGCLWVASVFAVRWPETQPRRQAAAPVCPLPLQVAEIVRRLTHLSDPGGVRLPRTAIFSWAAKPAELRQHFRSRDSSACFAGIGVSTQRGSEDDGIATVHVPTAQPVDSQGDFHMPAPRKPDQNARRPASPTRMASAPTPIHVPSPATF
jgi:hypothetical protein